MSAPSHPASGAFPHLTREALHDGSLPNDAWRGLKDRIDWSGVGSALHLSRRELELVQHIFDGKKLFAIAIEMQLARGTVKTYGQRIRQKLGISDQRELMLAVLEAHLRFQDAVGAPAVLNEKS